jgi:hypothetical protein
MITSLFRKSTPLNYALIIIAVVVFFFLYHTAHIKPGITVPEMIAKAGLLLVIFASLFTANFIVKKNTLSRDSAYTVLFYLLFLLFFPSLLDNPNLLLSNFFILLALRRLVSLHSPKSQKEKIFDASLWICIAALFHFWAIVFILLVFVSILFHVSRDYRNWTLPFMALFTSVVILLLYSFAFDESLVARTISTVRTDLSIDYFATNKNNLAISIYAIFALFFTISMLVTISGRPLQLQSSYKKIVFSFFLGLFIFVISASKSNDLLIFTIAPLAFMATSHVELPQEKLRQEIVLALTIISSLFLFFFQL